MTVYSHKQSRNRAALIEGASWFFAVFGMVVWSVWPAAKAVVAAFALKDVSNQSVVEGSESVRLEVERNLQKHFLGYGVYVPLEDIMFTERVIETNPDLEVVIKRVCGNAPLAIWVPLQFRLPLIGERSFEWCWKPSLRN